MINQHAEISPKAKLGANVKIGAFCVIGPEVVIGDNTEIKPHTVITGHTTIGQNNTIHSFVSIGDAPQDLKYHGEDTQVVIGDNNEIREFVTIHRGTTAGSNGITTIGNNNFLMSYVHIAHDCTVGSNNIFSNNASLAGHVCVDDYVLFGGYSLVAQFCFVASYSFLAASSPTNRDVLPFTLVSTYHGSPAKTYGLNVVGLRRKGFTTERINKIKSYLKLITTTPSLEKIKNELSELSQNDNDAKLFLNAINRSIHGFIR